MVHGNPCAPHHVHPECHGQLNNKGSSQSTAHLLVKSTASDARAPHTNLWVQHSIHLICVNRSIFIQQRKHCAQFSDRDSQLDAIQRCCKQELSICEVLPRLNFQLIDGTVPQQAAVLADLLDCLYNFAEQFENDAQYQAAYLTAICTLLCCRAARMGKIAQARVLTHIMALSSFKICEENVGKFRTLLQNLPCGPGEGLNCLQATYFLRQVLLNNYRLPEIQESVLLVLDDHNLHDFGTVRYILQHVPLCQGDATAAALDRILSHLGVNELVAILSEALNSGELPVQRGDVYRQVLRHLEDKAATSEALEVNDEAVEDAAQRCLAAIGTEGRLELLLSGHAASGVQELVRMYTKLLG